uniref:Uncharacterized protein n=1 Tax=Poecilia reticulata TaxID=8081 RepID=A0A3P9PUE7_POERE
MTVTFSGKKKGKISKSDQRSIRNMHVPEIFFFFFFAPSMLTVFKGMFRGKKQNKKQQNGNEQLSRCSIIPKKKKKKTYKFEHVPVKDVIVGESLSVEEIPEQLVCGELGCGKKNKQTIKKNRTTKEKVNIQESQKTCKRRHKY